MRPSSAAGPALAPSVSPAKQPHQTFLTIQEIDELIELKRFLEPELGRLKPKIERCEELTKLVRKAHQDDPGNKAFTAAGTAFDLLVGWKRLEKTPDTKKIYKFFGVREFVDVIAAVTHKAVKEAMRRKNEPESGADAFFTEARTGWREVTVVAKASPKAA